MKRIILMFRSPMAFPLLVATVFGLFGITQKSLWLDEVLTLRIASQDWVAMWHTLTTTEPYRWLYYVLLHGWTRFGSGDAYYRLLSVFIALTGVPGMYLLGTVLRSPRVGYISALLLAVHPMFLRYAQEIHSYSLLLSLSIWSSYAFIVFRRRLTAYSMIIYVLGAVGMTYAHNFGVFVVAAHYISLFYLHTSLQAPRLTIASVALLALGFLPFLLFPVPDQNIAWIQYPNREEVTRFILLLSGGHALLVLGFAGLLIYDWVRVRTKAPGQYKKDMVFLMIWFLFPLVSVLAGSYMFRPIFVPRYMIIVLPALLMLAADALTRLPNIKMHIVIACLVGLMVASNIHWHTGKPVYAKLGFVTFTDQEDWRGASEYIHEHGFSEDHIIFYPYFIRYPFEYYWNQSGRNAGAALEEIASAPYAIGGVMPEPDMTRIQNFARTGRLWLVLSHNMNSSLGRDRQTEAIKKQLDALYASKKEVSRTGITILLYEKNLRK